MTKSDDVDRYIDEEYIEDPGQFPVSPGDGCLKTLENDLIVETLDDSLYLFEGDILADEKGLERLSMFSRTPSAPLRSASIVNYNNVIVDLLNGQHYYYDVIDYELQ